MMSEQMDIKQVCKLTGLSEGTVYRYIKDTRFNFPEPNKVPRTSDRGPKEINRWERRDVEAWIRLKNNLDQIVRNNDGATAVEVEITPTQLANLSESLKKFEIEMMKFYEENKMVTYAVVMGFVASGLWAMFQ